MKSEGVVIAAHGRHYQVELTDGETLLCFPRGKKSDLACGDCVSVVRNGESQGVIETTMPRRTLLFRSDRYRQKLIAANVSQVVIVVATIPTFSEELITRCLIAAESQDINTLILLNKCDLADRIEPARKALSPFENLCYPILELSAHASVDALRPMLVGHTSVFVGQSGMGKSTLINALIPQANARTKEISTSLDSGKHTTTHATLYRLDSDSAIIDSPGLQEFGLHHLSVQELELGFREFRPLLGQCRFRNCLHHHEPGCVIHEALGDKRISTSRYTVFRTLVDEID